MNEVMRAAGGFGTLLYLSLTVLSLAPTPAAAAADEPEIARETLYFDSRGDIPLEHRWDITAILPDRDAWEAARKDVEAALPGLDEYRGRLGESAETLAAALGTAFDIARAFEDVYVYAGQSLHTQIGDADAQGLFATAQALGGRLQEASAFIDPELARIPPDTLARFLEHAALKPYYGPTLTVDDEYQAGWARVSHFYRTFYVWVYATSYAAGEAIARRFREGDETAVADYLAMLKLGGSVYPMQALERAGVDMGDPQVIRAVMDRYGELQRRLETELAP